MQDKVIAFIGAGNMGQALINGLLHNGFNSQNIWASNPTAQKLQHFAQQFGIKVTQDNKEAVAEADIVVLCVKPHNLKAICLELKDILVSNHALIVSVATGVTIAMLNQWLQGDFAIARVMPNTPAAVNAGATVLFASKKVNAEQKSEVESIFRAVGLTVWLDQEELLDAAVAVSGSGPAYFFLILEAMQQAAQAMGLNREASRLLAAQTALGAARMVMESDHEIADLRSFVTSPKGTTEQAIKVLETANIREVFMQAMMAARKRCKELTRELE